MTNSKRFRKISSISPNAASQPYDLQFIDTMIHHHQGAVEMAQKALTKAERPEIKTLSDQITKEQEAEIKQMADWKARWAK